MDAGSVPEVQGTGLRLFSGILSVVDLSGNNLLTASSGGTIIGNTTDNFPLTYIGPVFQFISTASGPVMALNYTAAPVDQKNTLLRLGSSSPGAFAISSATDANPNVAQSNLIVGLRVGASWSNLAFGGTGDTFPVSFATTGSVSFAGPVAPTAGVITGSSFVSAWPSGTPGGIFTAPTVPFSLYLVSCTIASSNDPTNYNTVALFSTNGPIGRLTVLQQGALMNLSISGLTVLFTQGNGATANVNSWWTKLI